MKETEHATSGEAGKSFEAGLKLGCEGIDVGIEPSQCGQMLAHYGRLTEANRHFNLTRITSPADAAAKHYVDSLTLLKAEWFDTGRGMKVLDVGTGAGFPAIPLAIMCLAWDVTAIDGTGKKARFVADVAGELGLSNLEARQIRAADLGKELPGTFDLVLLRAVAPIARGLGETHRLIAPGGSVVFYKTVNMDETELAEGIAAAKRLGLRRSVSFNITVPTSDEPLGRRLIRFERRGA